MSWQEDELSVWWLVAAYELFTDICTKMCKALPDGGLSVLPVLLAAAVLQLQGSWGAPHVTGSSQEPGAGRASLGEEVQKES